LHNIKSTLIKKYSQNQQQHTIGKNKEKTNPEKKGFGLGKKRPVA